MGLPLSRRDFGGHLYEFRNLLEAVQLAADPRRRVGKFLPHIGHDFPGNAARVLVPHGRKLLSATLGLLADEYVVFEDVLRHSFLLRTGERVEQISKLIK